MGEVLTYLPTILNNLWLYVILTLLVVTAVIFVHEMGHYLMGRVLGFRAELFSLGFGRELIGRTDRRGTRWSLRLYPLGGYVRFFGERITPEIEALPDDQKRDAFVTQKVWKRMLVAAAGPAINLLFSFLLLASVYAFIGRPTPSPVVAAVVKDSPAELMGIKIGDRIHSIDGTEITGIDQARDLVKDRAGDMITIEIEREGKIIPLRGAPRDMTVINEYGFDTYRAFFGWMWPVYGLDVRQIHHVGDTDTRDKPDLVRKLLLANANKQTTIEFGLERPQTYIVYVRPELNEAFKDSSHKDHNTFTLGRRPNEDVKTLPMVQAFAMSADLINRGFHTAMGTIFQIIAGDKTTTELGGVMRSVSRPERCSERGAYIS